MNIPLNGSNVAIAILILTNLVTIYAKIRNPQVASEKENIKLREELTAQRETFNKDVADLRKEIFEVKTTHIANLEKDMKDLTASISSLKNELTRLSTILDERIPKKQ